MNKKQVLFCTIIVLVILSNCACTQQKVESNRIEVKHDSTVVITQQQENFDEFYKRFYSDSIFQISRVKFPLKIYTTQYFKELNNANILDTVRFFMKNDVLFLKKSAWKNIDSLITEPDYIKGYNIKKDSVEEYVKSDLEGFTFGRLFTNIDGLWYFVLYDFESDFDLD